MNIRRYTQCASLLLLISLWLLPVAYAGTLTSSVDRTNITSSDAITLTVSYDTNAGSQEPDVTLLAKDFSVLSRSTGSNIQIINGNFSRSTNWSYELQPRKTGKLLIPSFKINNDFSDAITINVDEPSAKTPQNNAQKQNSIYSEVDITNTKHYVQEQILVTWRLISTMQISNPTIAAPQIANVLTQDMGTKQYERTNADGQRERVLEQRFAFFPQRSGVINIPAQQFQFTLNAMRSFGFGLLSQGQERKYINTAQKTINVLPALESPTANKLSQNDNTRWLPAKNITIEQKIIGANSNGSVTVGASFTRTIQLRAEGLLAEQLPPPTMEITGTKVYSSAPQLKNTPTAQGIIGLREDSAAIIPQHSGAMTLPAIHVEWYDIEAEQWRTAVLPAKTLTVMPSATLTPQAGTAAEPQKAATASTPATQPQPAATPFPRLYYLLAATLAAAIFIIAAWIYTRRGKKQHLLPANTATANTLNQPPKSKATDEALTAAANGDARAFCNALLQWAKRTWPTSAPLSINALIDKIDDADLRQQLIAMEAQMYGTKTQAFSQDSLAAQLIAWRKKEIAHKKEHPSDEKNAEQLHKLYD